MNRRVSNTVRRSGVYHFKKRIPKRLQHADVFGGAEFVQYSLHTKDADEAAGFLFDALREFDRCKLEAESELGIPAWESSVRSRRIPDALATRPSIRQVELAADRFYREYLRDNSTIEDDYLSRTAARGHELLIAGRRQEDWENILSELGKPAEENLRSFDAAVSIFEENRWLPDPDSKEFGILHDLLRRAEKTAIQHILSTALSDKFMPSDERDALFQHSSTGTYTLSEAVSDYANRNPEKLEIVKKMRAALGVWLELIKIDALAEIDDRTVVDFKEMIEKLPSRARQRFPNASISSAIDRNLKRSEPYPVISPKTLKQNYLGVLGTAVGLSVERKRVSTNPFEGIPVKGARDVPDHRRSFSADELNQIFRHPVFVGCLSEKRRYTAGNRRIKDHRYWAPLVAIFTGMRASEIGALSTNCLSSIDINGELFWYLGVEDSKTKAGIRDVPIHPGLVELGFLEYCQGQANREGRLFEDWKKPKGKKFSEARVIRNFNDIVCSSIGAPGDRPTFHCFRHTMQSAMIDAELVDPIQKAVLGHEQDGMKEHYFKPNISNYAKKFCERVSFPELDLSHLK